MSRDLVIRVPALNLPGNREKGRCGPTNPGEIDAGRGCGITVGIFQSRHEDDIVHRTLQATASGIRMLPINPAAFTQISPAVSPFFEIQSSDIHAREELPGRSLVPDIASGIGMGSGPTEYRFASMGARDLLAAGHPG